MAEHLTLSPAATSLLDLIEHQMNVSLEVAHPWLDPIRRPAGSDAPRPLDDPEIAGEAAKALRTGEVRMGERPGLAYGVFPLRRTREVVGCLIVSRRPAASGGAGLEDIGALTRSAVESDVALNGQLAATHALTRRLHGTLRFLGQLGTYETERDVMQAVLHAATVWFDLDCRIYERRADGHFDAVVALPNDESAGATQPLDAARVTQLLATRRFASGGDLEDLGVGGRREEVLVLPVGMGEPAWLIMLVGALDSHAELTFTAMARVLTGELQAREFARIEHWHGALADAAAAPGATPTRTFERMLESLVRSTGAVRGQATLTHTASLRRVAVAAGAAQADETPGLDVTVPAGLESTLTVSLAGPASRGADASRAVHLWARALTPWLLEVGAALGRAPAVADAVTEPAAFELRIQEEVERARRFNLGLGLVLIDPGDAPPAAARAAFDALAAALKPELRASDLLGRLPGGLAVVLVHANPEGPDSVTQRLRVRLAAFGHGSPVRTFHVGTASFSPDCGSAEELISRARTRSTVVRPLH